MVARLISSNLIVGLAPENTRSVDIIAMKGNSNQSIQIQVKTRTKGRSADEGWWMHEKHETIIQDNLYYIFVALPKKWTDLAQPETFIIPSKKIATVVKQSHKDWKNTLGVKGQKRNDTKMRRIKPSYKDSPSISSNWMEEFRDKWSIIGNF